jgi:hypothetical protein
MLYDVIPATRLNYMHNFSGLYNCVRQPTHRLTDTMKTSSGASINTDLRIHIKGGPLASTTFTFWQAPKFASNFAALDAISGVISVDFDTATDRAGMSATDPSDGGCGRIFTAETVAALGTYPAQSRCIWTCDTSVDIYLGAHASIAPGAALRLRPKSIRSKNRFSAYADSNIEVIVAISSLPVIQLSGTQVSVFVCDQHIMERIMRCLSQAVANNHAVRKELCLH